MSDQESATISLVPGMADRKLFADGEGCAMLFKRAGAISVNAQRRSEVIPGTCEFKLKIVVRGLFLCQVKDEREGFSKMLHAIGCFVRILQQQPNFLMAIGEVA